jgi:MOSC domain-containing protein YiiM
MMHPMTGRTDLRASIVSVQVGMPRPVPLDGEAVLTSIFKSPVAKRIRLRSLNLDGDAQADLIHHGGRDKTAYAYPSEHYSFWQKELPGVELPWGSFGENFTIAGLMEGDVSIGDRLMIGTAEVTVTQPRIPCFKLNLRFGREDMIQRFLASRRTGFYLRVLQEGEVGAGDEIRILHRDENRVSIAEIMGVYLNDPQTEEVRRRVLRVEYLSSAWRKELSEEK